MTEALTKQGQNQEDISGVSQYLKEHLNWKVQKVSSIFGSRLGNEANMKQFDGTSVNSNKVPSLVVTVQTEVVTKAKVITELPTYSNITVIPEATKGKVGGFSC